MIEKKSNYGAVADRLAGYQRPHTRKSKRNLIAMTAFFAFINGIFLTILPSSLLFILFIPLIIGGLIVIWILPHQEPPPLKALQAIFLAYFVALILWPYYLAVKITGFPLIEIRRIFAFIAILIFLYAYSTSLNFQKSIVSDFKLSKVFFIAFLIFFMAQILSLGFSPDKSAAISTFLKNQSSNTAIFFVALASFKGLEFREKWAKYLIGIIIILFIVSIFEYKNEEILWANHIPAFLQVNDPAMENLLTPVFRNGEYRVTGPFSVSLSFAEFLAISSAFPLAYIIFGENVYARLAAVLLDLAMVAAITLTQARIGLVGALVTHTAFFFIWAIRQRVTQKGSIFGSAVLFLSPAIAAMIAAMVFLVPALRIRLLGGGSHAASTTGRIEQLEASVQHILRSPLFGYGPQQGSKVLGYTNPAGEGSIDVGYLALILDYGIIGFVAYLTMLMTAIFMGLSLVTKVRSTADALGVAAAVALCVWLTTRLGLAQEDNASLVFILMAFVIANLAANRSTVNGH